MELLMTAPTSPRSRRRRHRCGHRRRPPNVIIVVVIDVVAVANVIASSPPFGSDDSNLLRRRHHDGSFLELTAPTSPRSSSPQSSSPRFSSHRSSSPQSLSPRLSLPRSSSPPSSSPLLLRPAAMTLVFCFGVTTFLSHFSYMTSLRLLSLSLLRLPSSPVVASASGNSPFNWRRFQQTTDIGFVSPNSSPTASLLHFHIESASLSFRFQNSARPRRSRLAPPSFLQNSSSTSSRCSAVSISSPAVMETIQDALHRATDFIINEKEMKTLAEKHIATKFSSKSATQQPSIMPSWAPPRSTRFELCHHRITFA